MRPRHALLVDKSMSACLAAIEIYNKPDFHYREETFSILMINAWELLLKAKIMRENRNRPEAIQVFEPRRLRDGRVGRRMVLKLNRAGNPLTIGIAKSAEIVRQYSADGIDERCLDNIYLLMEIRDNSVHLHNVDPGLGKRIQEVGTAALKNYVVAANRWFRLDLSRFNFYLMPLAFHSPADIISSLEGDRPDESARLLQLIAEAERRHPSDLGLDFNVTMRVELRFARTANPDAIPVRVARDAPDAIPVRLAEEDIRQRFPWDYAELTRRLVARYRDFRQNERYHGFRRTLEGDPSLCSVRHLDPGNPRSGTKRFYSPNIVSRFDPHYTLL
jgi:hypothetical protein